MNEAKTRRENIFKRLWRITGGGFFTALFMALALICIVLLIGIEAVSSTNRSESDTSQPSNEASLTQDDSDEGADVDKDGWIEGIDSDDTTNIGNRVNTSQLPDSSFIYEVSIEELANADVYLNDQTVQVTGEVVGDRIISETNPRYCWITLQSQDANDSEVSVYMSKASSKAIDTYGAYGKRGTSLQVRGTFNLACKDHQGTSDIHAESISMVSPGEVFEDNGNPRNLKTGLVLILLGSLLMLVFNVLKERQR